LAGGNAAKSGIPYLPPISPNDTPPTFAYTLQNSLAWTATKTAQTQYSVGFNVTVGFEGVFSASLKLSKTMEWTNLSSSSSNKSSTQSATVVVGGPSFNYAGPTDVLVYWDTVFSSFVFKFPEADLSLAGQLTDHNDAPIVSEPVTLRAGDQEATTVTDARGGFRFYGVPEVRERSPCGTRSSRFKWGRRRRSRGSNCDRDRKSAEPFVENVLVLSKSLSAASGARPPGASIPANSQGLGIV
jgi:hypothetical protein